eukprot:GHVU01197672.1.p1 GENE.GHVU01197672.1~~GHVU01197672.1.p1  ORF type:complete len:149 (+),score=16.84 GHVU01197672.1:549-995(+)
MKQLCFTLLGAPHDCIDPNSLRDGCCSHAPVGGPPRGGHAVPPQPVVGGTAERAGESQGAQSVGEGRADTRAGRQPASQPASQGMRLPAKRAMEGPPRLPPVLLARPHPHPHHPTNSRLRHLSVLQEMKADEMMRDAMQYGGQGDLGR